jgi:hypothetical protein
MGPKKSETFLCLDCDAKTSVTAKEMTHAARPRCYKCGGTRLESLPRIQYHEYKDAARKDDVEPIINILSELDRRDNLREVWESGRRLRSTYRHPRDLDAELPGDD